MNLFHLLSLSALALGISARPVLEKPIAAHAAAVKVSKPVVDEDVIPWSDRERLVWDDFMCAPRTGTDAVASTSTSLGLSYQVNNGQLEYHINCNFSKQKSWGLLRTDYILAHEQGHFDITEIYARKLNEAMSNYQFNRRNFKSDINKIYHDLVAEKEQFQEDYDNITDHSRNRKLQYEWLDKIQNLLNETSPYASYP